MIAHRDIKPENIVISYVQKTLFRMFAKFVIWDGLLSVITEEKLYVELLTMLLLNCFKASNMG